MNRRTYLLSLSVAASIAGCSEGDSEATSTPTEEQQTDTPTLTETPNPTEEIEADLPAPEIINYEFETSNRLAQPLLRPNEEATFHVEATLPVADGEYEARFTLTLLDDDERYATNGTTVFGDADGDQIETTGSFEIDLADVPNSGHRMEVELHDITSGERRTESRSVTLPQWKRHTRETERIMRKAFDNYAALGKDPSTSIFHVLLSSEFDFTVVQSTAANARSEAGRARGAADYDTPDYELVQNLADEAEFLETLVMLQNDTTKIFAEFEASQDEFFDALEREADYPEVSPLLEHHSNAEERHEEVDGLLDELDSVIRELGFYDDKLEQILMELEAANDTITGIDYILNPGFGTWQERAALARRQFDDIISDFEVESAYPPEDIVDQDFIDHLAVWHEVAQEIERGIREL